MRTLMLLLISTCVSVGWAVEDQMEPPFFLAIVEEDIIPEHMEACMKGRVASAKLCAQYEYEFPYLTFVDEFRVTTVVIFKRFAQIDDFPQKWEAWNEKTSGKAKMYSLFTPTRWNCLLKWAIMWNKAR